MFDRDLSGTIDLQAPPGFMELKGGLGFKVYAGSHQVRFQKRFMELKGGSQFV